MADQKISAMTVLPTDTLTGAIYVAAIQAGNTVTNFKGSVSTLLTGVSLGTTLAGQSIGARGGPGGSTSGNGGGFYGYGGAATLGTGGAIGLYAGSANGGDYQGGPALIQAGNGSGVGVGGSANFVGGVGGALGKGGNAGLFGGGSGVTSGNGGDVVLAGGAALGVGTGGTVAITSGNAADGQAGGITLTVGNSGSTATGNGIVLNAGPGGVTSGAGGPIQLYAGSAVGTGLGGDVKLKPGTGTTAGHTFIFNVPTTDPGATAAVWQDPTTGALLLSGGGLSTIRVVGRSVGLTETMTPGTYDLGVFPQGGTVDNSYTHVVSGGTMTITGAIGQPGTYTAITGLTALAVSTAVDSVGTASAANVIPAGQHLWLIEANTSTPVGGSVFFTVKVP